VVRESPRLAVESIGKSFGRRQVLNSASLWVYPGAVTALVGRNGQGKSTLFKIAAGLERADYGIVRYGEDRFTRTRLPDMALRGLFFLPERSLLCRSLTLRKHFDAIEHHFGDRYVDKAVDLLNVGAFLDREAHRLSGGEQRRAELAIAVARGPGCLLADEPFLGIPPRDAEFLTEVFRRLARDGCAVAITGHEVRSLFETADDVLWMTAGTTHALGTPAEAREHHQFVREYLGFESLR
jgi:lipopolysaccharide export system ATP-binding protein